MPSPAAAHTADRKSGAADLFSQSRRAFSFSMVISRPMESTKFVTALRPQPFLAYLFLFAAGVREVAAVFRLPPAGRDAP